MSGSQRRCPTYSISVTFSIGDFFAEHGRSTHRQKNPGRSRGQTASNRLAVLLLSALALSALTALTALTALSGLLLLLAWLLLAAALLLARLVLSALLAALLLAGVLLVRIVHNVSYFSSSP